MQKKCFAENLNLYDVLLKDKLIMSKISQKDLNPSLVTPNILKM